MPRSEIDLAAYVRLLWRRKGIVALVTVIVTGAALTISLRRTPVYEAQADLLMQPRTMESLSASAGVGSDPAVGIGTEIQVLTSRPVVDSVIRRVGLYLPVSVSQVGTTAVVHVRVRSEQARLAAVAANAYASSYIDYRRTGATQALLDVSGKVQTKLNDLQQQLDTLDAKINGFPDTGPPSPARQETVRQRDALLVAQQADRQRLDQLQLDATLQSGGAQLISPATTPGVPIEPKPLRTGVLAGAVGLMLGLGAALVMERLDDSVRSKEELAQIVTGIPVIGFTGVPVIGLIPASGPRQSHRHDWLVTVDAPASQAAEAHRSLRTALQILALDKPIRALLVTSPVGGDGKTTTLANLAVTLSQAGQRVVIVNCDLRRPMVHARFGLSNDTGLTSVVFDGLALGDALQSVPGNETISVLAAGPAVADPSELLSSQEVVDLFDTLQKQFDIMLIDSPPVLPVTDAVVLSARVDATLLVARMGRTTRKQLRRATEILRQSGAPLVGTVLNGVVDDGIYRYGYGYHDASAPKGPKMRPHAVEPAGRPKRLTPAPLRPVHSHAAAPVDRVVTAPES